MYMPSMFHDNLFDDFFSDFVNVPRRPITQNTVMKTDIKESDQGFEVDIDLPGYKKEDVQAELKDGTLTITAAHNSEDEKKDDDGKYIRRERFYGNCSRAFYVGKDITQEDIKARFEDGILRLQIPKKQPQPAVAEKKLITIEG